MIGRTLRLLWGLDSARITVIFYLIPTLLIFDWYTEAMALYTIARRRRIKAPLLAWVPLAKEWTLGCISDQYQLRTVQRRTNRRHTLLWWRVLVYALLLGSEFTTSSASGAIFIGAAVVGLVLNILRLLALRDLIRSCAGRCSWWVLMLLILVCPLARPICLLRVFLRDDGLPMERGGDTQPAYMARTGRYIQPKRPVILMMIGILLVLMQFMPIVSEYVSIDPDYHTTTLENLPHYTVRMGLLMEPRYSASSLIPYSLMRPVPSRNGWYYHPLERFDAFQAVFDEVYDEVAERIRAENMERFGEEYALGTSRVIGYRVQEELKQRYDIDWLPSSDLNTRIIID